MLELPYAALPGPVFNSVLASLIVLATWQLVASGQTLYRWLQFRGARLRSRRWR